MSRKMRSIQEQKFDQALGERIAKARREKRISASALARKVGVTRQQFYKYETGIIPFRISIACAIAEALGIPLDDLLSGSRITGYSPCNFSSDC